MPNYSASEFRPMWSPNTFRVPFQHMQDPPNERVEAHCLIWFRIVTSPTTKYRSRAPSRPLSWSFPHAVELSTYCSLQEQASTPWTKEAHTRGVAPTCCTEGSQRVTPSRPLFHDDMHTDTKRGEKPEPKLSAMTQPAGVFLQHALDYFLSSGILSSGISRLFSFLWCRLHVLFLA